MIKTNIHNEKRVKTLSIRGVIQKFSLKHPTQSFGVSRGHTTYSNLGRFIVYSLEIVMNKHFLSS